MSNNKIALVFGGSRGIGAACVQTLAGAGFDVAYTYVTKAPNKADAAKAYRAEITSAEPAPSCYGLRPTRLTRHILASMS